MLRSRAVVATTLIGAIVSLLIAAAAPVYAADAKNPEIGPPSVSNPPARPAAAGPAEDLVLTFVKAAGSHIGGKAFNFVMAQLGFGDPTPALLRGISNQLAQVNAKLDRLEESVEELKRLVGEGQFTQLMLAFNAVRANVDSINDNGMQEVALAADNLANVLSSPSTPDQVQEATECLHEKRQELERLLDTRGADTNLGVISSLMSSSAGETTLVNAYGRLLLHKRYVNRKDSQALRAFYDYLEQYQALAAIQRAEWQVATGKSRERIETDNDAFFHEAGSRVRPPGLIQIQRAALPDLIPEGVLIDVGATGETTTTLGKPMLFPMGGSFGRELHSWRDPDNQGHSTGQAEAVSTAASFAGPDGSAGLSNWRIIKPAEWNSLMAGKKEAQTGTAYLNAAFGLEFRFPQKFARPFEFNPFVWIDTAARQHRIQLTAGAWVYPVHRDVVVSGSGSMAWDGPAARWNPNLPTSARGTTRDDLERLRRAVANAFMSGSRLILSRTTDVSYMALKVRPPSS